MYYSDEGYLFPTNQSPRLKGHRINEIVRESAKNAGLNRVVETTVGGKKMWLYNAHSLRHSHAIQAIKSGIDVRRLMEMMGHNNLDVTLEYLRIVEADYVKESRKFNPFGD
jgi:integrase/recombinase XerD